MFFMHAKLRCKVLQGLEFFVINEYRSWFLSMDHPLWNESKHLFNVLEESHPPPSWTTTKMWVALWRKVVEWKPKVGDSWARGSNHGSPFRYEETFWIPYLILLAIIAHPPSPWSNAHCEKHVQIIVKPHLGGEGYRSI
jgi:hypothetical protein